MATSINVASVIKPASGDNTFAVVEDFNLLNSYRVVPTHAARNAIDSQLITAGALVGVVDSDGLGTFQTYRYLGGGPSVDANWVVYSTSAVVFQTDNFTPITVGQTIFGLSALPVSPATLQLSVNGVIYTQGLSYTLNALTGIITWLNIPFTIDPADNLQAYYEK